MNPQTVEDLLHNQLSACVAATEDCLAQSRAARPDDPEGQLRRLDLDHVAKLMKASARLTEALAQLRGERRQTIHVRRSVDKEGA
jgi:hypothetical protein